MSHIILKNDLFNELLLKPAKSFDELCVISGFATPAMVSHHLEAVKNTFDRNDVKVNLIIGMTPTDSGISKAHHKNFVKLVGERNIFKCSYINPEADPAHTKLYTWLRDGRPQKAFLSSANYTLNAFRRQQDEVATECDPAEAYDYYKSKLPLSLYCDVPEAEALVRAEQAVMARVRIDHELLGEERENIPIPEIGIEGVDWVKLPLYSIKTNSMQTHSGLNWGQRDGRDHNQAYIPVPSNVAGSGFFPPRGQHFSVITSDGFPFVCVIAQDGDKAIHTPNDNSELGRYFRNRLGLVEGAPVSLDDLDRFGNRFVKFTKINEEEYYMEFDPVV
jgi:hypothetical protein